MSQTNERLQGLGIELPVRSHKGEGAVDAVLEGNLLFVSAHLPVDQDGKAVYQGKLGGELTVEDGYKAARLCGMNMLTTIQDYIGDLDRVEFFVKCLGLVNSTADFSSQPAVMNGFSDLMVEVFGRRGQHARSAMGAFALPQDVPVVVEAIIRVRS